MKNRSLVLAGAVVLTLGACATMGLRRGGVVIDDTYAEIHPGTNFSPDDEKKLAKILSQYENKIYWVEKINEHKIADGGTLSCVYVDETFLKEVGQAESAGTSYSAIQIGARREQGNCDHLMHTPNIHHTPNVHHTPNIHHTPFLHHTPNPHLTPNDYRKCKELVKQVTPILQKYSQK